MPILAIESATTVSSVAVAAEDRLLAEVTMQLKRPQSEVLLEHLEMAMQVAQCQKKDLTAIAVDIGPGSFTGLRIGLATAKMMAYALKLPLIAVDIATVLAYYCCLPEVDTATFIDAQKGNVYFAITGFENGKVQHKLPLRVLALEEAWAICENWGHPLVYTGDIAQKKGAKFPAGGNLAQPHLIMPRAANVAFAAWEKWRQGEIADVMNVEPLYIRRSEAEELWERKQQNV